MLAEGSIDNTMLGLVIGVVTLLAIVVGLAAKVLSAGHNQGAQDEKIKNIESNVVVLFGKLDDAASKVELAKVDQSVGILRARSHAILRAIAKIDIKLEMLIRGYKPSKIVDDTADSEDTTD